MEFLNQIKVITFINGSISDNLILSLGNDNANYIRKISLDYLASDLPLNTIINSQDIIIKISGGVNNPEFVPSVSHKSIIE